jgi:hydrocephalus-inducing protein
MNAGASRSLEVSFTPSDSEPVDTEVIVEFLPGGHTFIGVTGQGQNVDVSLSTSSLTMDSSFISLLSHRVLKIKNSSSQPVKYTWKSYKRGSDEEEERDRLLHEINRMQSIERVSIMEKTGTAEFDLVVGEGDDALDLTGVEDQDIIRFSTKAEEAAFIRKYRNLRLALENDAMEFIDDIFDISPISGTIWPNSEMEISVVFRPDTAADYTCLAYLDVTGREERLPLHITGRGIGPNASLSFEVLDVGDVFINLEQKYEVTICNRGDIIALWTFVPPNTRFGSKFTFYPKEGALHPGETQTLGIVFESDVLGEFSEFFRFSLQGNEHMLSCHIKGHVIGPTFHFDCEKIEFGSVSFDYLHTRIVRLANTSSVPVVFNLHIPQDGQHNREEFDIVPHRGTLLSGTDMHVLVCAYACVLLKRC